MVDVTDSTRIEAALRERATALEEADRVKTDFVANMSYELRTPLTSIGGFAEMLAAGYAGKLAPAAADYVAAILESVARLAKLIDDVLDLTQGDARGVCWSASASTSPACAARRCEALRGHRLTEKKQKLDLDIDSSTGVVIGDARRLRESIEHVLATRSPTPDRGRSCSTAERRRASSATITITDNGEGIAAEDLPRVFDRFDRIGEPTRGEAALGLGLPLTRQFIEAHGGTVELESKKGKGTTVTLSIPRAPQ